MPRNPPSRLDEIRTLTRAIPKTESYLKGRIVPPVSLPANIVCFVRRRAEALNVQSHPPRTQHHRFVLIVSVRGSGRVCIDADSFFLREGQVQLVFPFQFHSYLSVQPANICWVFLTFEMERETDLEALRSSPSRKLGEIELMLLAEILRHWTRRSASRLLQLELASLLNLLNQQKAGARTVRPEQIDHREAEFLSRVNRHVMAHLDERLVLKELAATVGYSESNLRRRFRIATGMGLGRHLRELRLQQACSLLHRTFLPVGEVALACGFDSIYAFSRAFKKSLGSSPRAYRRGTTSKGG